MTFKLPYFDPKVSKLSLKMSSYPSINIVTMLFACCCCLIPILRIDTSTTVRIHDTFQQLSFKPEYVGTHNNAQRTC